jgi:hypothetical protein
MAMESHHAPTQIEKMSDHMRLSKICCLLMTGMATKSLFLRAKRKMMFCKESCNDVTQLCKDTSA